MTISFTIAMATTRKRLTAEDSIRCQRSDAGDEPKQQQPFRESRLLTLPPEIRNMIYEHVLLGTTTIDINRHEELRQRTALLRTCQQIRIEALNMFYARNSFRVTISTEYYKHLLKWLQTVQATSIGDLLIELVFTDDDHVLHRLRMKCLEQFNQILVSLPNEKLRKDYQRNKEYWDESREGQWMQRQSMAIELASTMTTVGLSVSAIGTCVYPGRQSFTWNKFARSLFALDLVLRCREFLSETATATTIFGYADFEARIVAESKARGTASEMKS